MKVDVEMVEPESCDSAAPEEEGSWWTRRCGGREVLTLAFPLVVSTISWTLMNFIDRTFLTWYNTEAMAAAMPAGAISFTGICLPMGIASYVGTFVAQYNGSKQYGQMGPIVWQGVWIGVASMPVFLLLRLLAPLLFSRVGHPEGVALLETAYYRSLMFGAAAVVISSALSGFFSGRGETKVIMCVDSFAALLNVGLDYLWIFGLLGFSEGGIVGAGIATAVSSWCRVAIYLYLMWRRDRDGRYCVRHGMAFDWSRLKRLFHFGGPNGLQMFIEMMAFSAYLLLVGQLGATELGATTLAFNVNQLAFVPMLGLGYAASILVGNQIGENQPALAARATWTTLWMGLVYTGVMAMLYWCFPDWFLIFHAFAANESEFEQVRAITVVLLRFVAAYCMLDAVAIVFASAIKGAGDTRFVLIASVLLSPIPVVLGWVGIRYWNWGLTQFWFLVTFWVCSQAAIYATRFRQGKWRSMKVIEQG